MAGTANYVYRDTITDAHRLLGVIGQGEDPSGTQAVTGLRVLRELLDEWNAYLPLLYTSDTVSIDLDGSQTYLIGPGGSFLGATRPSKLLGAWYRDGGVDYPLEILGDVDYGRIVEKMSIANQPVAVYLNAASPNASLTVYPVSSGGKLVVRYAAQLPRVDFDTPVTLPPAYQKAIRYNLAVSLAPEFGIDPPVTVMMIATSTKAKIISANSQSPIMQFSGLRRWNIELGV